MKIYMISCVTSDMYIGYRNNLLVSLKPDMNYFKMLTMGHVVVMGKNTYLSLPGRKPLPNRTNVIISTTMQEAPEGFELYHDVDHFINAYHEYSGEVFVIGGSKIYDAFMPFAEKIYFTYVQRTIAELYSEDEIDYSALVKFPNSLCKYSWDFQRSVDECCIDEKFGIVHYCFLTLLRR